MVSHNTGEALEKLYPILKRCLGRDENYDLRMDAAMVSHMHHREVL